MRVHSSRLFWSGVNPTTLTDRTNVQFIIRSFNPSSRTATMTGIKRKLVIVNWYSHDPPYIIISAGKGQKPLTQQTRRKLPRLLWVMGGIA